MDVFFQSLVCFQPYCKRNKMGQMNFIVFVNYSPYFRGIYFCCVIDLHFCICNDNSLIYLYFRTCHEHLLRYIAFCFPLVLPDAILQNITIYGIYWSSITKSRRARIFEHFVSGCFHIAKISFEFQVAVHM